jgi:acyl-CoA thioesterase-1
MDVIEFYDRFTHSMQSRQSFERPLRHGDPATQHSAPPPYGKAFDRLQALRRFIVALLAIAAAWIAAGAAAEARPVRVVALGDSLSAGYQLPADDAFPTVLQKALRAAGLDVDVANAGVSGDTSAGGLERLDWSVPDGTDAVILELGANDMLRGLDPQTTQANLDTIVTRLQARGIKVLLAGMYALPSLGRDYAARFDAIYPALAKRHGVPLYPFFLAGVSQDPGLKLADGMHPNPAGVRVVVGSILPSVENLVRSVAPKS